MRTPPLFVLRLKYFDSNVWHYFTSDVIVDPSDLNADGINLDMLIYSSEREARQAMLSLILQKRADVQACKLVELSHYPPYPEHQVLWYQAYEY